MGKGFRRIDNKLFQAIIAADLTRSEYKVVFTVMDFTIGYQKQMADVSLSTFQKMTGLARTSVIHAIRQLEREQVLIVNRDGKSSIYGLRHIDDWTGRVGATNGSSVESTRRDVETLPANTQNTTNIGSVGMPATPHNKEIRKPSN